jgi:N-acetylglucosamine malate deacetylase 1
MNKNSFSNKRILVVVAHPDDEVLGVGGTLHRLIHRESCEVKVIILGEGITARGENRDVKNWELELSTHQENIKQAAKCIGFSSPSTYDFADNRFDSVDILDIVKVIEKEISEFKPDIVFTHHFGDLNIDHQLTAKAVVTATRPLPGEPPLMVLTFETPSSTEYQIPEPSLAFLPQLYIPLTSDDIEAKKNALKAYKQECREYPHPRSTQALEIISQRWGTVIGAEYAEAFCILRWILD